MVVWYIVGLASPTKTAPYNVCFRYQIDLLVLLCFLYAFPYYSSFKNSNNLSFRAKGSCSTKQPITTLWHSHSPGKIPVKISILDFFSSTPIMTAIHIHETATIWTLAKYKKTTLLNLVWITSPAKACYGEPTRSMLIWNKQSTKCILSEPTQKIILTLSSKPEVFLML